MKILGIVLLSLLGLILLILALVLFVPFRVYAAYRDKTATVRIKFLFFRYTVLPQKKKKKKKKKKPKKKKKDESPPEEDKKKKKKKLDLGLIVKLLKKHLPPLLKPFRIKSVNMTWFVHARDAAETALLYGAASGMVAGALAIFQKFARRLERARVDLFPDYDGDKGGFAGDITVSFIVFPLLVAGLRAVRDLFKYKIL